LKKVAVSTTIFILCALNSLTSSAQTPDNAPLIRIEGVNEALEDNIRIHLGTLDERCNSTQRRLDRLIPSVRRDIERASQALGYYRLTQQINFQPADPDDNGSCWQLQIIIQAGQAVRIGDINIEFTDPSHYRVFEPALSELPIRRGDQLNHSHYERLKAQLSGYAVENGYFSARFLRSELAIDLQNNLAHVNLEFEPGERFRFGEIRISPMEDLSDNFLSRFLTFEAGSDYSTDALIELRQKLNDSQYFSQVIVSPLLSQAVDQEIPVTVELGMRPRRSYSAGAGVSTDIGPRLRLMYEDRYINRRGHRLNAELGISPLQLEPSVSYVMPLRDPVNESLRFSGGFQRQETDSYISSTYRVGVTYRTVVWDNWVQNIFVNFQHENAELTNVLIRDGSKEQTNSTISGINWARTRADDPIYPTRGWRLFGQFSGSHENLLSDISFAQIYGSAKLVRQFGPGRVLLRGEAATTLADEVLELPFSVRFFTGGDLSVRGYQFGELGATNSDGEVVGGKHLLVGSVEYDIRVRGNWLAAAFIDVGNSFGDFGNMKLKQSAGLGVRWLSPIGPIRFDIAKGLGDGSFRFHITMGPDL
jgi:translocation and assembly module TamA